MRRDTLGKLYDRLAPEERFRLDVEAMARGDMKESELLTSTCPRRTYNMTDWAFSGRWQTIIEMVLALSVALSQYTSRLSMIDAIQETLPYARVVYRNEAERAYLEGHEAGSRYAWERAGMDADPPGWEPLGDDPETAVENFDPALEEELELLATRIEETDIMPELLSRLEQQTVQKAWTVWETFACFARESLEVTPEKLIKALFEPALCGIEDLKERKERLGVEPDEGQAAECEAAFSETWECYLRKARGLSS
jgi:hypothetical protein